MYAPAALLEQGPGPDMSLSQRVVAFKEAFWKFLRPHTIRGTILGSSAVTAKALLENSHVSGGGGLSSEGKLGG